MLVSFTKIISVTLILRLMANEQQMPDKVQSISSHKFSRIQLFYVC